MDASIRVDGLAEVRKAFRDLDREIGDKTRPAGKRLKAAYAEVGEFVAREARARASTRLEQKMSGAIVGVGRVISGARVQIRQNKTYPAAFVAFWGIDRPIGWFAKLPGATGAAQGLPAWVGSSWEVGGSGGPHAINPAIRDNLDRIVDRFEAAIQQAAHDVGLT